MQHDFDYVSGHFNPGDGILVSFGRCSCGWESKLGARRAEAKELWALHVTDAINNGPGSEGNIDPFSIPAHD